MSMDGTDIVDRIEKELQIPKKSVEISIPTTIYNQLAKETDEKERIHIFKVIAKNIDERTEEVRRDVDRMLVSLRQLQNFSANLTKIEEPLNEQIFKIRQQRKALATENALNSTKILNSLKVFEDLEKSRIEATTTSTPLMNMDTLVKIKKDKLSTEKENMEKIIEEKVKNYIESIIKKPKK